jgi:hypothetical protein
MLYEHPISEEDLKKLLADYAALKIAKAESDEEVKICKEVILNVMRLLGLADENNVPKTDVLNGEESFFPSIIKGLGDIVTLATRAQIPMIGKKAAEQLKKKFEFIERTMPLLIKYANEHKQ